MSIPSFSNTSLSGMARSPHSITPTAYKSQTRRPRLVSLLVFGFLVFGFLVFGFWFLGFLVFWFFGFFWVFFDIAKGAEDAATGVVPFGYYVIAPILRSKWVLLGEISKVKQNTIKSEEKHKNRRMKAEGAGGIKKRGDNKFMY